MFLFSALRSHEEGDVVVLLGHDSSVAADMCVVVVDLRVPAVDAAGFDERRVWLSSCWVVYKKLNRTVKKWLVYLRGSRRSRHHMELVVVWFHSSFYLGIQDSRQGTEVFSLEPLVRQCFYVDDLPRTWMFSSLISSSPITPSSETTLMMLTLMSSSVTLSLTARGSSIVNST